MNTESADANGQDTAVTQTAATKNMLVEVGWIVCGENVKIHESVLSAQQMCLRFLEEQFPGFDWRMPVIYRNTPLTHDRAEPTELLYEAFFERDKRHWDIALMVTPADLKTYQKPSAFAIPSQGLNAAVLSAARLADDSAEARQSDDVVAQRLKALVLHLLGDLNGVSHSGDPQSFMYVPQAPEEMDGMRRYQSKQRKALKKALTEVADLRVEEMLLPEQSTAPRFYARALAVGIGPILRAAWEARPWLFPFYLSRLTLASVSALVVLMLTAESWDLAMSQSLPAVLLFAAFMIVATSAFILRRQRLLMSPLSGVRSEQLVVTNATVTLLVLSGMLVTFLLIMCLALLVGELFFSQTLLQQWAAALDKAVDLSRRALAAGFFASVSIAVGALGASFEGQHYVAHVAYADEEL